MRQALSKMDATASRIYDWHHGYHQALKIALGEALDSPDAGSQLQVRRLHESVTSTRLGLTAGTQIEQLLGDVFEVVDQAIEDAGGASDDLKGRVYETAAEHFETTCAQLLQIIKLDETVPLRTMQNLRLKSSLHVARGVHPRVAMNMVKGGAFLGLTFSYPDRSGKLWNSAIFTRTTVRGMLVALYNQAFLSSLLEQGVDTAAVTDANGARAPFRILGPSGSNWDAYAQAYMHPNTNQLVQR